VPICTAREGSWLPTPKGCLYLRRRAGIFPSGEPSSDVPRNCAAIAGAPAHWPRWEGHACAFGGGEFAIEKSHDFSVVPTGCAVVFYVFLGFTRVWLRRFASAGGAKKRCHARPTVRGKRRERTVSRGKEPRGIGDFGIAEMLELRKEKEQKGFRVRWRTPAWRALRGMRDWTSRESWVAGGVLRWRLDENDEPWRGKRFCADGREES